MESIFLVSSKPLTIPSRTPSDFVSRRPSCSPHLPVTEKLRNARKGVRRTRYLVSANARGVDGGASKDSTRNVMEIWAKECFASISRNTETYSIGTSSMPVSPPPSSIGSPLFWIGVGVGFSALFSWVANYLKKYAMQQAFKTLMGSMAQEKGQFSNSGMFPGPTFRSTAEASSIRMPPPPAVSQSAMTIDVPDTKVEPTTASTDTKEDVHVKEEPKRYSFVDVSPEDVSQASSAEGFGYPNEVVQPNGSAVKQDKSEAYEQSESQKPPLMTVEALEKMMEDPTVQKMVYPYLPEEMRNPSTFKWMLQNPQYRAQLQEMLNNMGGSSEWDNQMVNSLKNFNLSSPEVKQQFDQIGLTPEEVISKIMANPEVAMSFQNPRVQAAIMDCSQNPLNIQKYQDDKEVMDVFNKISELFPGVSGSF